jgi:adenylate cyclase
MMVLKRLRAPGLKEFFWRTRGIWIASPTISLLVIALRLSGFLQGWEWRAYDLVMRSRPPLPQDSRIVIVGIDEKDVAGLKTSIFSDQLLADLLTKLKAMQPKAIGLDIYRDVPVPPGEAALAKVFASTPNLIGIQKVAGQSGIDTVAPAPILKARNQIAANDLPVDADNVIRRGFVYLSNGQETFYSFALYLALIYLDSVGVVVEDIPGTDNFRLNQALFQPLNSNEGSYIRADAGGFQLLINYKGGKNSFPQVSMTDILQQRIPQDWGKDRIILIGKVGESFKDSYFTPYSDVAGLAQPMPGVEIHANIISSILSAALESRPLLRGWPEGLEWLWIMAWSTLGAILSWQFRYRPKQQYITYLRWGSISLSLVALVGISYGALLAGWWIPFVPPFLGFLGSSVLITTLMARAGAKIRQTFGRYLTDQVVANLLEHPEGLQLGGDRRRITLLTSDLRGFTATSERLSPEEVIKILNLYLGAMAEVITHYQGTIDEFMGDGILVLFGAPTSQADDALRAVACAVAMQQALGPVNQQIMAWGLQPLEMGIGINTGEVVVGNIGSEKRTKYGVVGSQVNLTYRIESYTTGGQVLISESTLLEAGTAVKINGKRAVKPKGVKNDIVICDVGGVAAPYDLYLTSEEDTYVPLLMPLALSYAHLDGKHLDDTIRQAQLVQLSRKGGQLQLPSLAPPPPSPLTNIKLNFQPISGLSVDLTGDVYAKVIEGAENDPSHFYIYFSARPPDIETYLNHLYETIEKA